MRLITSSYAQVLLFLLVTKEEEQTDAIKIDFEPSKKQDAAKSYEDAEERQWLHDSIVKEMLQVPLHIIVDRKDCLLKPGMISTSC